MKFHRDTLNDILSDDYDELLYKVVYVSEWEQDYKYQNREVVFFNFADSKFYMIDDSRSGSPFSHWEDCNYFSEYEHLHEVEKREIVVSKWVRK